MSNWTSENSKNTLIAKIYKSKWQEIILVADRSRGLKIIDFTMPEFP